MAGFWEAATTSAGHEFGRRHYRWFAGVRIVRRLAPLAGIALILGAAVLGVAWLAGSWASVSDGAGEWAGDVGRWVMSAGSAALPVLLWVLLAAVGVGLAVGAGVVVARNWWRWSLHLPYWMRRY
jgi:hypothetical protein